MFRARHPATRTLPRWTRYRPQQSLPEATPNRRWWQTLIEIAAVIAVPSALLYALGVVVFWLRIANEYDSISISTTWYAASLVPRSTAAASGIEVIVRGILYGTLLSSVVLLIQYIVSYARLRKSAQSRKIRFFSEPLNLPVWLLFVASLIAILYIQFSRDSSYGLLYILRLLALMVSIGLLLPVLWVVFSGQGRRELYERIVDFYPIFTYQMVFIVAAMSVFISILFPREASLSCLWKEDSDGEVIEANVPNTQGPNEPIQWTLQGGFLSKNGGTWYVLTESNRLQAIPDDQAIRVVEGEFSVKYLRIGRDGTPVGEPVSGEDMKSRTTYVAVKDCSTFPSQPTIYKF